MRGFNLIFVRPGFARQVVRKCQINLSFLLASLTNGNMDKSETKKRIEKLRKTVNYHRYLYHVLDKEEISDAALDSLKNELYKLEQENPEFITPDSPTQRVGGQPLEKFKKAVHKVPMLSIDDIFDNKELQDWENYLKQLIHSESLDYFCEYKIDGFAVSLIYEKGIFVQGATRGDGKVGEDVTQNLKTIESIPLKLEVNSEYLNSQFKNIENSLEETIEKGRIEVRGEVYMGQKEFEKFNKETVEKGEEPYSNPRNLAAGSIRQLDSKLAAQRPLKFLAYDIVTDFSQTKHSEEHRILTALGFKPNQGRKCKNLTEVLDYWKETAAKRGSLIFQIDGIVVQIDNNAVFKKLGVAGKSPRAIRALKFAPKQATTIIRDVKFQVGRTGAVTPVAILEPVKIEGVIITRASLHNEDEIKELGVKIGDTVIIERAGDVIPAVIKVLSDLRSGKEKNINMPRNCPVCKNSLVRPEGEAVWRCPNLRCIAVLRQSLHYFVSKKGFDIDGLGPKIIDHLLDENLIFSPADIFNLTEEDLAPLERFGEKSAQNLFLSIQKSKKISLARLITALGIRFVGEETAIDLAQYFGSLENIKNISQEELEAVPDIGPRASESIYNWFRIKENKELIDNLIKQGIDISAPEQISKKLSGKTFVLTGSLEDITRNEAKQRIRFLGGKVSNSVSQKIDYVVKGREPGTKYKKAKELGVKIINEQQFLAML